MAQVSQLGWDGSVHAVCHLAGGSMPVLAAALADRLLIARQPASGNQTAQQLAESAGQHLRFGSWSVNSLLWAGPLCYHYTATRFPCRQRSCVGRMPACG